MRVSLIISVAGLLIMAAGAMYLKGFARGGSQDIGAVTVTGYRSSVMQRGYYQHLALLNAPRFDLAVGIGTMLFGFVVFGAGCTAG